MSNNETIERLDRCVKRAEALAAHGGYPRYNGWQVDWEELCDPHEDHKHEVAVVARQTNRPSFQCPIAVVSCIARCETEVDAPKIVMDDHTDGDENVFSMESNPGAAVLAAIIHLPDLLLSAAKVVRLAEDIPGDAVLPDCVKKLLVEILDLADVVQYATDVEGLNEA